MDAEINDKTSPGRSARQRVHRLLVEVL